MDFTEQWGDTCSRIGYAARLGDLECLRRLIRQKKAVDVADNRGWRPLHEAAALGPSLQCMEELLKHNSTDINWKTHEGETALLLACKRRRDADAMETVSLLLRYGADPNIVDNEEESPLLSALRSGSAGVVTLLIQGGADVDAPDCSRWSPLHEAAQRGEVPPLQALLTKGARLDTQDECGMTPIFTAAQYGRLACLKELLTAAMERGQECVVNIGAEDWATPLMIAAQQGFADCVEVLLQHGADPSLETSDHATAIHMAVQGNHRPCLEILLSHMNIAPLVSLFHPHTWDYPDMICPLHLAIEWESHDCLQVLLKAGFSPDSLNCCQTPNILAQAYDRESALSFAVSKPSSPSLALLLSAGASCNPPTPQAYPPICRAMQLWTLREFQILLEGGADVNLPAVLPTCLAFGKRPGFLHMLLHRGCDPARLFSLGDEPGRLFVHCSLRYMRVEVPSAQLRLEEYLRLLLRFLAVDSHVRSAFLRLSSLLSKDITDLLQEMEYPSSLRHLCSLHIRRHLYFLHGVRLPQVVPLLHLPPSLEVLLSCPDLDISA